MFSGRKVLERGAKLAYWRILRVIHVLRAYGIPIAGSLVSTLHSDRHCLVADRLGGYVWGAVCYAVIDIKVSKNYGTYLILRQ